MKRLLVISTFAIMIAGCSSPAKKFAEKVGCKEDEATVIAEHSSPIHETYSVECRGKSYVCTESPVGSNCKQRKSSR